MDQQPPGQPPAAKEGRHRGLSEGPVESLGFWSYGALLPIVLFEGFAAMGWGIITAFKGDLGPLARLSGVASVVGGALLWLSFMLFINPQPLTGPQWGTPSRQRAVFAFRFLWAVPIVIILPVAKLAHWIATR